MTTPDDAPAPRHRRPGRAHKRGRTAPGRHSRVGPAADCGCPPGFHEYGAHAPGAWPEADINPPPPGAYPVEDLAAMSPGAASLLLHRAQVETEADGPTCAHIVVAREESTGVLTYNGPFATGLEALTFAHRLLHDEHRSPVPARRFTLTVAPVYSS